MDLFGWIGWTLSFILAILNIWQFRKNRVILKIECLEQNSLISEIVEDYEPREETRIKIKTFFKNKGLEPITIGEIVLLADLKRKGKLERAEMSVSPKNQNFEKIRLDGNDIHPIMLYATIPIYLPEKIKKLNIILIFKTSHKDIEKRMTLHRTFTKK